MKLSELIQKLQDDFEVHGDMDVVYQCDCRECDCFENPQNGHYEIGGIGWYSYPEKGEKKIELICADCKHNSELDHIRGKYGW